MKPSLYIFVFVILCIFQLNIYVNSYESVNLINEKREKINKNNNNLTKEQTKIYRHFVNDFCSNTFKKTLFLSNFNLINFRKKEKKIKKDNNKRSKIHNNKRLNLNNNLIGKNKKENNNTKINISLNNIEYQNKNNSNSTILNNPNKGNKEKNIPKRSENQNSMFNERVEVSPLGMRLETKIKTTEIEYNVISRNISFIISDKLNCHSLIKEKIVVESIKDFNLLEHWILHNNFDNLEIKSIKSPDANVNFFFFNKKFSLLSIYFTPNHHKDYKDNKNNIKFQNLTEIIYGSNYMPHKSNKFYNIFDRKKSVENLDYKRNYTFEFEYIAYNLILSHHGGSNTLLKDYKNWSEVQFNKNYEKKHKFIKKPMDFDDGYNYLVWKFFNKNYFQEIKNLRISIIFDLGLDFVNYPVLFSPPFQMSFKKSLVVEDKIKFVKYVTDFKILPQEVMILDMKFPLIFSQCSTGTPNVFMVAILSILIIFMIFIIYIIFSIFYYNTIL